MDSPYSSELKTAIKVVEQAAKLSQSLISSRDKGVIEKDDLSPVTVGDFAIQALLAATLRAAFPADGFVGEEDAAEVRTNPALLDRIWDLLEKHGVADVVGSKDRVCEVIDMCGNGIPERGRRIWVFDPIDGTKTYVRGEMYAINVALLDGGKQVLSVVGLPVLSMDVKGPVQDDSLDESGRGSILFAVKGHGAYGRPLVDAKPDEVRRLDAHAERVTSLSELRSVTSHKTADSGIDDAHAAICQDLGVEFPGSDLLGWVPRWSVMALGLGNMTVWIYKRRDRLAKIWDHAGAMLLFEEVGGKVTDVDGRDIDLSAGRKMVANYGFVAAPASIHAEVLKGVRSTLLQQGKAHLLQMPETAASGEEPQYPGGLPPSDPAFEKWKTFFNDPNSLGRSSYNPRGF